MRFEFPLSTLWSPWLCDPLSSGSAALCIVDALMFFISLCLPFCDDIKIIPLLTLPAHFVDAKLFRYLPPEHRCTSDPMDSFVLGLLLICFVPCYVPIRFSLGISFFFFPASHGIDEAEPLLGPKSTAATSRGRFSVMRQIVLMYMLLAIAPITMYLGAFVCWVLSIIAYQIIWLWESAWNW